MEGNAPSSFFVAERVLKSRLIFILLVALVNSILLFTPWSLLGVVLLTLILPGWGWAALMLPQNRPASRLVLATGLSYAIGVLGLMLLHYLPGPVTQWHLLILFNTITLLPLLFPRTDVSLSLAGWRKRLTLAVAMLIVVLSVASVLRFVGLGYSEFQGDEALAMITSAELLEGHQDALFLRGKGPGEALLHRIMAARFGD